MWPTSLRTSVKSEVPSLCQSTSSSGKRSHGADWCCEGRVLFWLDLKELDFDFDLAVKMKHVRAATCCPCRIRRLVSSREKVVHGVQQEVPFHLTQPTSRQKGILALGAIPGSIAPQGILHSTCMHWVRDCFRSKGHYRPMVWRINW